MKTTGDRYNPADLLKLYIHGYLNRVRSSRRLEIETRCDIELIWLLCRLTPECEALVVRHHSLDAEDLVAISAARRPPGWLRPATNTNRH